MKKAYLVLFFLLCAIVHSNGQSSADNKPGKHYDEIEDFHDGMAAVEINKMHGFIDISGHEVVPCIYYAVENFSENFACVANEVPNLDKNKRFAFGVGFINREGKIVIPIKYQYSGSFRHGLAMVCSNDKWGFIDTLGNQVIPCQYDDADEFIGDVALVQKGEKYGYINKSGAITIPFEFEWATEFSSGMAAVKKGDKYGFIDANGKLIVPYAYDAVNRFRGNICSVKKGDKWGIINKLGNEVLACESTMEIEYDGGWDNYRKYTFPPAHNKYFFIIGGGGMFLSFNRSFEENRICVERDRKYGFVDTEGKLAIPYIYDLAINFSNGRTVVKQDGKYLFIDKYNHPVTTTHYDEIWQSEFSDRIKVKRNGKYGVMDTNGKEVITCIYDNDFSWGYFSANLIAVRQGKQWGYIDKNGKLVVKCKYSKVGSFCSGLALVAGANGKMGYINEEGKQQIPIIYDDATDFSHDIATVLVNGKWNYIDNKGKLLGVVKSSR